MWNFTANIDVLLYVLWMAVIIISLILIFSSQRGRKRGRVQAEGENSDGQTETGKNAGRKETGQSAGRRKAGRRGGLVSDRQNEAGMSLPDASHKSTAHNDMTDSDREDKMPAMAALALGGVGNIKAVSCSDTRLRVRVENGALVDRAKLAETGTLGVLAKNGQVQVFYENPPVRLCRELAAYVKKHRASDSVDMEDSTEYERVLEKIFTPVEGDVVRLSDIYHVQDMGDGGIGGFAVHAKRGEIRAPFDCKAGYSEAGGGTLECCAQSGIRVSIALVHSGALRLHFGDGEKVRKGRLLAEFFSEEENGVYCMVIATVSSPVPAKLIVHPCEDANYEHVACEVAG